MANEKRKDLISRKDLIKAAEAKKYAISDNTHPYEALRIQGKYFREVVDSAPTVDAVEVVHGQWVYEPVEFDWKKDIKCSICGEYVNTTSNYCPNCGAKMDGGDDNA